MLEIAVQHIDFQIKQCFEWLWGMSINANEETLNDNTDASYPDANHDATSFEYRLCWCWYWSYLIWILVMLILKLLNLKTGYADTDADTEGT